MNQLTKEIDQLKIEKISLPPPVPCGWSINDGPKCEETETHTHRNEKNEPIHRYYAQRTVFDGDRDDYDSYMEIEMY
jgi:hypothetical protein